MALTIGGCFKSKTCHVTALGWMKKEERKEGEDEQFYTL